MKILVIGLDKMCFWCDGVSLEPVSASFYDAYAFNKVSEPDTMSISEWQILRNNQIEAEYYAWQRLIW